METFDLAPIYFTKVPAADYVKVWESEHGRIRTVQIVPPSLDFRDDDFGSVIVELETPLYAVEQTQ